MNAAQNQRKRGPDRRRADNVFVGLFYIVSACVGSLGIVAAISFGAILFEASLADAADAAATPDAAGGQAGDSQLVTELSAMWEAQRTSIATASITYRWIHVGGSGLIHGTTPEDAEKILASLDLVNRPDDIKLLAERFTGRVREGRGWVLGKLEIDGDRIRSELRTDDGVPPEIHVRDGKNEIVQHGAPNQQTDIFHAGGTRRRLINWTHMCAIPPRPAVDRLAVTARAEGQVHLTAGTLDLVVDEATGAVHRMTIRQRDGSVWRELRQWGFTAYPGDVLFPAAHVRIDRSLREGTVHSVEGFVVETASFNHTVPDGAFTVATKVDHAAVYDHREDKSKPKWRHLRSPVSDVLEPVETLGAQDATSSYAPLLITLVCLIAIAAVFFALRLRRGSRGVR